MDKETKKINLGCGGRKHPGYVHVDIDANQNPDILADASDLWMIDDEEHEGVLASHIIEHFLPEDIPGVLKEWKRIMRPNATIQIRVPNLPVICEFYLSGRITVDGFYRGNSDEIMTEPDLRELCQKYLSGDIDAKDFSDECFKYKPANTKHHVIFDRLSLVELLQKNGFSDVVALPDNTPLEPDSTTPGRKVLDTLVVTARKPFSISRDSRLLKLGMVMTRRKEMPHNQYCAISKLVLAQLPYLVEAGIEPHVFSIKNKSEDNSHHDGVYYHRHNGTLQEYLKWVGVLSNDYGLDIVEVFNRTWQINTKAKRLIHMSNDHIKSRELLSTESVDGITLISDYLYSQTIQRIPEIDKKTRINKLGVDTHKFHPMAKADPPVLLWVGLLDSPKGLIHFVQVANRLLRRYPNLQVKVVGPASLDEGQPLNEYAKTCISKADPKFQWIGEVDNGELPEIFGTATIMLAPMQHPFTWSLAIMEAQASGTAVVTSDIGGLSECIVHGETGYALPYTDVNNYRAALFNACDVILSNPDFAVKLGKAARKFALHYSWERTAKRAIQLYTDIHWNTHG